jgi:alpha-tubulin suppressor-like RCC1 family protein
MPSIQDRRKNEIPVKIESHGRLFIICSLLLCLVLVMVCASEYISNSTKTQNQGSTSVSGEQTTETLLARKQFTMSQRVVFVAITVGADHACVLTANGGVKCWGDNLHGQLGDGSQQESGVPMDVVGLSSGVRAISAGESHTCALTTGGGVKCWGVAGDVDFNGVTDLRDMTTKYIPGLSSGVTAIASGDAHTCALTTEGGVKCWGENGYGQLGDIAHIPHNKPINYVRGLFDGVTAIAGGGNHACALMVAGGVKCWGDNRSGQLGDGSRNQSNNPVDVSGLPRGVKAVVLGMSHTCALMAGGEVKCWGDNLAGQLGDGTKIPSNTPVNVIGLSDGVIAIAAGGNQTCALISSGIVKCWGDNQYGQLGNGLKTLSSIPVEVNGLPRGVITIATGEDHTCVVTNTGDATCWGDYSYNSFGEDMVMQRGIPVDVMGLASGVKAVATGLSHTCALTAAGGVKCWGRNDVGQLGDGTQMQRSLPVEVSGLSSGVVAIAGGEAHTCALMAGGGVKCWGDNEDSQLGDGTANNSNVPVDVRGLKGVTAISVSGDQNCALTAMSEVICWGGGRIGVDVSMPSFIVAKAKGFSSGVQAIASGEVHTCALTAGGGVKCWGENGYSQLGNSTVGFSNTPVNVKGLSKGVLAIAAGGYHTCALTTVGGVKCWGSGGIGNGISGQQTLPVVVFPPSGGITAIAAGGAVSCALTIDGGVKCWGDNQFGQIGNGMTYYSRTPVDVNGLSSNVTAIATGGEHTCALVGNGRLKCWGNDFFGQLGIDAPVLGLGPVEVANPLLPNLTVNYPNGRPGSFFTITGWYFTPETQVTISINGQVITSTLSVNPTGSFIFFLDTTGAEAGTYTIKVNEAPTISASFQLADDVPLRSQEGGGIMFRIR